MVRHDLARLIGLAVSGEYSWGNFSESWMGERSGSDSGFWILGSDAMIQQARFGNS